MRKRNMKYILLLCLFIAGCGKNIKDENHESQILESEKNQEIIHVEYSRSINEYEELKVISKDMMSYRENGKYGVIDINEKVLYEPEYDYIYTISAKGDFVIGKYLEDGYDYIIINSNLDTIFTSLDYKNYKPITYNEDVLELRNAEKNETLFLNGKKDFEVSLRLNETEIPGYIACSSFANGYTVVVTDTYTEDGFVNLISLEGDKINLKHENNMIYTYLGCALDENGWVLCYEVNPDNTGEYKKGFYNIKSNTFCSTPDEFQYVMPVKNKDSIYYASINNFALIKKSEESKEIYLFDLSKQTISQEAYSYVELQDSGKKLMLYSDITNQEWSYLSKELIPSENKYKDATSYNNSGYALINMDNNEYIINLDGDIVSDAIEGKEAVMDNDIFIVENKEKYFYVKIK